MLAWAAVLVFAYGVYYLITAEKKKKEAHEMRLREIRRQINENEKKKKKELE